MYPEKLLKAATLLSRISDDTSEHSYAIRIKMANRARQAIEEFIAEQVNEAQAQPTGSPFHLSWDQIGQCLELSKSAVFARYGSQKAKAKSEQRN